MTFYSCIWYLKEIFFFVVKTIRLVLFFFLWANIPNDSVKIEAFFVFFSFEKLDQKIYHIR